MIVDDYETIARELSRIQLEEAQIAALDDQQNADEPWSADDDEQMNLLDCIPW